MSSFSEITLSNQSHPGDSTTQTVTGEKYKGDGYYGRSDGFHTVQYNISGNSDSAFTGTITMQATLATLPTDDDWFTVSGTTAVYDQFYGSETKNFTGNYVWVRVYVSYTDGTISSILLNH